VKEKKKLANLDAKNAAKLKNKLGCDVRLQAMRTLKGTETHV
jgi:hypothetical protein